ncbi:hypothetical protein [Streptomyces sp. NPDC001401]|uniref:hypothetical protein n=1 Tax=Streptomyces sp. NPDC001401 TaxID=3364570 RepID=UPI0036CAEDFE
MSDDFWQDFNEKVTKRSEENQQRREQAEEQEARARAAQRAKENSEIMRAHRADVARWQAKYKCSSCGMPATAQPEIETDRGSYEDGRWVPDAEEPARVLWDKIPEDMILCQYGTIRDHYAHKNHSGQGYCRKHAEKILRKYF